MFKNTLFLTTFCLMLLLSTGCRKEDQAGSAGTTNISDIKVPTDFDWASSRNVGLTTSITDTRFGTALHRISVYNGDPYAGGSLLAQGTASTTTPFTINFAVAKTVANLYVVKTSPDNSSIVNVVPVSGSSLSVSFDATDPTVRYTPKAAAKTTATDCSSGCTSTITSNASNVNVNNGNVICITGNNITVSFSGINGGTIRVCGSNVTLQNCNLGGTSTLLITSSGSASMSSLNYNSSNATVQVDGRLTLSGSFADNGTFTNNGTVTCSGDLNINSNAKAFVNNGTITVSGNFNNGGPTSATNNGSITVTGAFQQNSGAAAFVNNCNLKVGGNYNQNTTVKNYSYIKVSGTLTINSGTELGLYNGAMVSTNRFMSNSPVKGYGSTSLLKISGSVTVNSGGGVNGAVQVSSASSFSSSYLSGGASTGSSVYIAKTDCNSEGNGTPAVTDSDNDGVADSLDAYPNDATMAYNNYYPSSTGSATLAFEDQWPRKGDYDMNDLVMGYQYKVVTNASNVVVKVFGTYRLYASGGEFGNGFAVQFPIAASKMTGLSGATQLTGQSKAVIQLFTSMRDEMTAWNTVPGATTASAKNYSVSFNVTDGPTLSTFGLNCYNPYIWHIYGQEIHLPGRTPTDNVTSSVLGTGDDATNASTGKYYVTSTGLPFALDIPVMPFAYPSEAKQITQAYLRFADWAQSNGNSYTDWYSNTGTGYRNTGNIYK